ncbi:MAG: homocysteine S-methyltransferase family protein [Armatimonadia bacterium]
MTKKPFLQALTDQILIANGAMGTMLAAKGVELNNTAIANLEYPDVVREICAEYFGAGARVFQSNTFAANQPMLDHAGVGDRHDEINRAGFRIVKQAVGDEAYVAANFGPTGLMLRPLGKATTDEVSDIYRRQAQVLLAEGPDFVLLETFEALDELEAAVAGVRAAGLSVPLAITFSFSQASGRSMMGVTPHQAAETMVRLGADIIGSNCGLPQMTLQALREMARVSDKPLMIQANAGLPQLINGVACFTDTPLESSELAREAVEVGARIIGGCCGTTPAHVRAITEALA